VPKKPTTKTPRRTAAEVAERDYYRNLPDEMGEVQRAVWGHDEAEFEYALQQELANSPPRPHVSERKVRRRWK
jgi:hypothetical protein